MKKVELDKSLFRDSGGRYLTQSLFLEFQYDPTFAVFTFAGEDREYNGKLYYSLKRLFLDEADPIEYQFATKYLADWQHWQRMNENKMLRTHFDEWREELEVSLRSEAIRSIVDMTAEGNNNFQAMKWLADRGWDKRGAGRPSKSEKERESRIRNRLGDELQADIIRMEDFK